MNLKNLQLFQILKIFSDNLEIILLYFGIFERYFFFRFFLDALDALMNLSNIYNNLQHILRYLQFLSRKTSKYFGGLWIFVLDSWYRFFEQPPRSFSSATLHVIVFERQMISLVFDSSGFIRNYVNFLVKLAAI